jgi:hypothetical protein
MSQLPSIHEAAEAEINEAADFYDAESPGLGDVFIEFIVLLAFMGFRVYRVHNVTRAIAQRLNSPV